MKPKDEQSRRAVDETVTRRREAIGSRAAGRPPLLLQIHADMKEPRNVIARTRRKVA